MESTLDILWAVWYPEDTESELSIREEAAMKNRLEALRKERGIRQEELALALGVSRQTISLIERGDYSPSVMLALKLAAICGVTVEEIFSMDKEDLYVPEDPQ